MKTGMFMLLAVGVALASAVTTKKETSTDDLIKEMNQMTNESTSN
jgi:hypothetical protein